MKSEPTISSGTQSIERSILLMRSIASRPRFGWSLSDLAQACRIDKGTARRILKCLMNERLVERSEVGGHYLPGPLLFELGLALPKHDAFRTGAVPLLRELADKTQTAVFLALRSGDDVVCAALVGSVPGSALRMTVGSRRPMSNTAAGTALLVEMPPDVRRAVFQRNVEVLAELGIPAAKLELVLDKSLEMRMGWNEGWFGPNWNSYALPIFKEKEAWASVMMAASSEHFGNGKRALRLDELRKCAGHLQSLSDSIHAGSDPILST